jgi:OmpA-OmpF porin, OOP family
MNPESALFRLLILLLLVVPAQAFAQRILTYDFSNDLKSVEGAGPALRPLGEKGRLVEEALPELGTTRRTVYQFDANSGLQFSNRETNGFLSKSFTVEMYFKMTAMESWKRVLDFKNRKSDFGGYIHHGKLNFFNLATGEKAAVKADEYVHYVYSRDAETGLIRMYVDGESKVEFKDTDKEGVLDEDEVLNFFQDDLVVNNEASAGSVALIRLYDQVMTPVLVRRSFRELARKLPARAPAPVREAEPAPPPPTPVAPRPTVQADPERLVITGKVYDSRNLGALPEAEVSVRSVGSDSLVAQTRSINGEYRFAVKPLETYRITASTPGFQPRTVVVQPGRQGEVVRTLHSMAPEVFDKPIATLPFVQSKDSLITDAQVRLDSVARFLQDRPDLVIRLEGHTDNIGEFDKNIQLSWQRVTIVKEYLIGRGVAPGRIEGKGFGPSRPASHNNSEPGRQQNRRVEVWASPQKR